MLDLGCRTGSSLAVAIRDSSLVAMCRPLIVVASLVWEHRLWGTRASVAMVPGSRAQSRQLWCIDLVAPGHVGSSRIRDQTRVSCVGRQILYRWAQEKPPPGLLACQNKGRKGEPSVGSNPNCTTYHLCGCLIYMMIRWLRVTLRIHTCKTLASVLSN